MKSVFQTLLTPIAALLCLLVLLTLAGRPAAGQTTYGSIVGTVTDPSGAAIPSAGVTLTNIGTDERRTVESDAAGNYRFVNLIPGSYRLQVQTTGFKRYNREPIRVEVGSALRIDSAMEVGDVAETVTVSAETPLLQTQTGTVGAVIEGRVVQEMPLNGRNVLNLIALAPGVVPQGSTSGSPMGNQSGGTFTNNTGWGNYQIGGGMANQNAFYLDGVAINTNNANSPGLVPTMDAIQEFRVDTNSVSPEYGRFSGGVVNMATKSGTNQIHGSLYEYLRNRVLNANDFFNNRSGVKRNSFTQNQYGVTGAGPVVRDKVFLFFSWEGFGLRNGKPTLTTVPTAAMRVGNFTGLPTIYDPYSTCGLSGLSACATGQPTRTPFPLNQIPATRFDSTAQILMNNWALPNLPGNVNNWAGNADLGGNQNQYNARGDYNIGTKQRLFGRYTYWNGNSLPSDPFHKNFGGTTSLYGENGGVFGDTWTISPSTILDVRASYQRALHAFRPQQTGTDLSQYGPAWAALASQVTVPLAPVVSVSGFYGFGSTYIKSRNNLYFLSGGVIKMAGAHTLKFGAEGRRWDWGFTQTSYAAGVFTFDNLFTSVNPLAPAGTGYSFASYLLGTPSSNTVAGSAASSTAVEDAQTFGQMYYSGYYLNDSYRATNKLTVNLGMRLDVVGSFSERFDRLAVFLPQAVDPLGQQVNMNLKGQLALVNSPAYPSRNQLGPAKAAVAPRVGVAYTVAKNTVVRAGYGVSQISPEQINYASAPFQSPINATVTAMITSLNLGLTPFNTLSNPFPNGLIEPSGHNIAALRNYEGQSFNAPIPNPPFPYVQQWNLEIQQQFRPGLALNVGYSGAKTTHLPYYRLDINSLSPQTMALGSALLKTVANPFYGVLPSSAGTLAQPTTTAGQLLRPYPQFLDVMNSEADLGDSTYHSLQVRLVQRLRAGGTIQFHYTWSKLLSDTDTLSSWLEAGYSVGAVQDPYNLRLEKSLVSFNVANRLVISYVLDLPVGTGKKFLANARGVAGKIISGWGLAGVCTFQSGFPLALTTASNTTNSMGGGSRPNVISSDTSIAGSPESRVNEWFNTAAFAQPAAFTYGNESRTDPHLRGKGISNWNVTLVKQTTVTERASLEFRAEFFNLMNHVQFAVPGLALGNAQFGIVSSDLNQPRLIQLGLRLRF